MSSLSAERNPVECLAEEFAQRCRLGEHPSLSEYTQKYPHLADEIRDVFPALQVLEELKPGPADLSAPFADLAQADARPRFLGEYRLLRGVSRGCSIEENLIVNTYYKNKHGRSAANNPIDIRRIWAWTRDPAGTPSQADRAIDPYFGRDLVLNGCLTTVTSEEGIHVFDNTL